MKHSRLIKSSFIKSDPDTHIDTSDYFAIVTNLKTIVNKFGKPDELTIKPGAAKIGWYVRHIESGANIHLFADERSLVPSQDISEILMDDDITILVSSSNHNKEIFYELRNSLQ